MNECSEVPDSAGLNPFDEDEPTIDIPVGATVHDTINTPSIELSTAMNSNKNPFASAKDSSNPFETDDESNGTEQEHGVDYEYVSLTAPAGESSRSLNREWEFEWEQVANTVKRNFATVNVVAPEVVSTMMTK